jgi:hypothetical protein
MKRYLFTALLAICQTTIVLGGVMPWNQPTSPAEIALSDAVLSLISEPQGLSVNPSFLPGVKWKGVNSSGVIWPLDIYGGSVSGVLPLAKLGVAAAGISYWNYGQLNAYDRLGNQTGTINPQAVSVLLGFGRRIYGQLCGGINFKGSRSSIGNNDDYSWGADLAFNYDFSILQATILLRDIGPRYPVNDSLKYDMLKTFSAGIKKSFLKDQLTLGLQLNATETKKWHPLAGIEYSPLKAITIRFGYDGDDTKPERSKLGLGFTFKQTGKQDYAVEYGYRSWGQLGTVQALALVMSF